MIRTLAPFTLASLATAVQVNNSQAAAAAATEQPQSLAQTLTTGAVDDWVADNYDSGCNFCNTCLYRNRAYAALDAVSGEEKFNKNCFCTWDNFDWDSSGDCCYDYELEAFYEWLGWTWY